MSAKLQIDASSLRTILDKNPEIEIELIKSASAQIAEQLKRKIATEHNSIVVNAISEIENHLNYRYALPEAVLKKIGVLVEERLQKYSQHEAEKIAKNYFEKSFDNFSRRLEKELDSVVTAAVEKKVAAVFATAARMK